MSKLKIAMIGCGWVNGKHAGHLSTLKDEVDLVAFVDPSTSRAEEMARQYGAPDARIFGSHEALFQEIKPDCVVVGIPPFAHSGQVEEAARRGVHIFIEKPIALTTEKAWQMADLCEKNSIVTQVGFMYRFGAVAQRVKELSLSGAAGTIGLMSARYFCNSLHTEWWRSKEKSGGQVFEQAIHMIDLMRYFLGDAVTAYSLQNNLFHREVKDYTVEDVSGTVFGFQNGGIGVLYASNGAIPNRWEYDFRLVAKKLTVQADDANHALITYTAGSEVRTETVSSDQDVYDMEMDQFLAAVRTGAPTTTPMREGAMTVAMAAAAMKSAQSHQEESI
jgi:predicted dehydrogenase